MSMVNLPENIDENNVRSKGLAIDIKNASFEYKKGVPVLENVSYQTKQGQIFALLGPSGCGKTTLIRAILGRLQLKGGTIRVFGTQPGTKYSDIPGNGVGYMPQELAVFEEFTIKEILTYYGTIFHLEREELVDRIESLTQILNLPKENRPINTMSGGQKRRVSIAITMIHRPKLIILDEPTVGVDSILRNTIWNYLEECCVKNGQTVLITTHYIEEARSAANVAFLSNGTILRQSDPQKLLQEYNSQTLEAVFLQLCQQTNERRKSIKLSQILQDQNQETSAVSISNEAPEEGVKKELAKQKYLDYSRIKAMFIILFKLTIRRPSTLIIFFITPFLMLSTQKLAFSRHPTDIPIVIYNADQDPKYSQIIIDGIDRNHIDVRFADSNETAFQSVANGTNIMSVVFGHNFSDTFEYRVKDILDVTDEELESSEIRVYADFSNAVLSLFGLNHLIRAFNHFLRQESHSLGANAAAFLHLISVEDPIYGSFELGLNDVIGPGHLLVICHIFPLLVSSLQLVNIESNSGLERLLVSGVRPIEIIVAHFIINLALISTQLSLNLFIAFGVYQSTQIGSYFDVYVFLFLIGIQGMAFGFLIGMIAKTELGIVLGVIGFAFPLWLSSGVFWPSEAIPASLLNLIKLGPLCQPILALRAITLKGMDIRNPVVFNGFILNIFYISFVTIFNVIFFNKFTK